MDYGTTTDDVPLTGDAGILQEALERFRACEDFYGVEYERIRQDTKFANGDDRNTWQWPDKVYETRTSGDDDGIALTINTTRVNNDLIINSICKNDYGVRVRPTGGKATYKSAKIMQSMIRRIEYISRFTAQRRRIAEHQVDGGIAFCLIETKFTSHRSFNQDIYLKAAGDPTGVFLDPWNRDDPDFGFVFDRLPRKKFNRKYPKWKDKVGAAPINSAFVEWISDNEIMVGKYHRKSERRDTLVSYKLPNGDEIEKLASEIKDESGQEIYDRLIEDIKGGVIDGKTRPVTDNAVEWFLIVGDKIVERGKWAGKHVPIVRCVGRELVIDATLDLKGNTRALVGQQRMLNYSASMAVESVSSQPLASYLAPARSIEGQEQFKTMNINRFPVILYNDIDDEAPEGLQKIDPPTRQDAPMPSQGHMANMQAAERWGMMISGQATPDPRSDSAKYPESGKALGERQQQGETATYHFPEHQSDMLRGIGVQLLDLIPKIYDTERTLHIIDDKNEKHWIKIDPKQDDAAVELDHEKDDEEAVKIAFNPSVGEYECISDPGPDYATQRQEAFQAMSMLMSSNKEIAASCADLLFKYGDFPGADELMERLQKEIKATKPYLFDDKVEPQMLALQQQMQRLTALNADLMTKLADANLKIRGRDERRDIEAFRADTERDKVTLEFLTKVMLTPQQKAQLEHELEGKAHQHVYDMIQQANAPAVGNGSGQ